MDKNFIKEMEAKLKEQQKNLRKDLASFAEKNVHKKDDYNTRFPNYGNKDEENAVEVADFQDNLSLENDLEKNLAEVGKALERIKIGTYGKCEKCGKKMGRERLEAFPAAITCVDCKNLS
ncbi:MAG: hypothetical protein COT24_03555 [Candidatus Kerfeldbacteria bacterium CG08_land_8_20_14_0_20_40_16]|uniref:Zinc finger DksA/TraR C4-type domain-containing protein n=1 Tax=Candidatus Kerfeldbacteria bacterium CG08_land_8_20_14_0_20_40_16 TaxID=2014244 RepID=A0A2H0YVB2_9BACT|nr:MAG: hypothetical protein COT24_03555 [Candidatus Kerfeldbacteria bacterium CG08_land_8_20_14_0_20_40_16]